MYQKPPSLLKSGLTGQESVRAFDPCLADRYHGRHGRGTLAGGGLPRARRRRGPRAEGGRRREGDPAGRRLPVGGPLPGDQRGREEIANLAFDGPGAPAHPRFPVTQGLSGAAVASVETVVVGDVRKDPRYLTAFGSTRSEIIVPVVDRAGRKVVGTIDVESEEEVCTPPGENVAAQAAPRLLGVPKTVVFGTLPSPLKKVGAFSYLYPPPLHSVSITTRIGEYTRPLPRSYCIRMRPGE